MPGEAKRKRMCTTCAGITDRVKGARCAECGLAYAPETVVHDLEARRESAFARAMTEDGSGATRRHRTHAEAATAAPRPRLKGQRYNFQDMRGRRCGIVRVVRRAESANGNARWWVRAACGHEWIAVGTELRARPPKTCPECRRGAAEEPDDAS